ncbi:efflux RND transporter permease subunit [Aestuariicella hydrocarbonica]|uniref:Efflux RND transporter permease subunit n=1 Tax=Pseudomaricurvus hydrocarbonicus TaxID=1470433 RepID=A0A9E5MKE1_9GAMM|nr:efflux RND transporter permease subunit [Aestuariicella hydrocarbonica]
MSGIIAWFVDNRVAANLLMWVMVAGGLLVAPMLHREEFPNMDMDIINVEVIYPMASAEEVEKSICIKLEEAVSGTEGVKKIRTTAAQGQCTLSAELLTGADKSQVLRDFKNDIDKLDSLPEDAELPVVSEHKMVMAVLQVVISGDTDEHSMKAIGDQIKDDISDLSEVSQVSLIYQNPEEISLEISEINLRRHGLTLHQVAESIRENSINLPGGMVKTHDGHVLLKTQAQAYWENDFADLVILAKRDGTQVRLGDIAHIVDGFEDREVAARFDGARAMIVDVRRIGKEDIIDVSDAVKRYLDEAQSWLPEGIDITVWQDESEDLRGRMQALSDNAISGMMLVFIVLILFMRLNLAVWVCAGIPIALLGALLMFPVFDISISTVSTLAIILVLGIVVDDAVVVGERVYAYQQLGASPRDAAIAGTQEVSIPVIFGVLTTIVTFIPMLSVTGPLGGMIAPIGLVAILALIFSLIESQLVLPSHLASHPANKDSRFAWVNKCQTKIDQLIAANLMKFVEQRYKPFLQNVIAWRYTTLSAAVGIGIVTVGMLAGGHISAQFFPPMPGERLYASVTLPQGIAVEETQKAIDQLEVAAQQLTQELDAARGEGEPESRVKHILVSMGQEVGKGSTSQAKWVGGHYIDMAIELNLPEDYAGVSPSEFASRWRELTGAIPNAVKQTFDANALEAGNAIEVQVRGKDLEHMKAAAAEIKEYLYATAGVFDIYDSFEGGKQEVSLALLPQARNLGLTTRDLARQVRQAFYGEEVQRIQRGEDEIKVFVRYPEAERRSLGNLEQMRIRTSDGVEVPFSSVAQVVSQRGISRINRVDGRRVVSVVADVDRSQVTPDYVLTALTSSLFPELERRWPGIDISLAGEAESQGDAFASLGLMCLISLFAVYALLAIPLKSYLQPLVVMSVVPFGVVGAIWGHVLMGEAFVFFSIIGVVALAGVVVNASLVLVDKANRLRKEGMALEEALVEAACERFKPIILTSSTTFIGLLPLMSSSEWSTKIFVPISISLGCGVLFSTLISLLLVPALYRMLEDRFVVSHWWGLQLQRLANVRAHENI